MTGAGAPGGNGARREAPRARAPRLQTSAAAAALAAALGGCIDTNPERVVLVVTASDPSLDRLPGNGVRVAFRVRYKLGDHARATHAVVERVEVMRADDAAAPLVGKLVPGAAPAFDGDLSPGDDVTVAYAASGGPPAIDGAIACAAGTLSLVVWVRTSQGDDGMALPTSTLARTAPFDPRCAP